MLKDEFYQRCCLEDKNCSYEKGHRKIEFHHHIIFGGKQLQEVWAILPVCSGYHHKFARRKDLQEKLTRICVSRATSEELKKVSKVIRYDLMK